MKGKIINFVSAIAFIMTLICVGNWNVEAQENIQATTLEYAEAYVENNVGNNSEMWYEYTYGKGMVSYGFQIAVRNVPAETDIKVTVFDENFDVKKTADLLGKKGNETARIEVFDYKNYYGKYYIKVEAVDGTVLKSGYSIIATMAFVPEMLSAGGKTFTFTNTSAFARNMTISNTYDLEDWASSHDLTDCYLTEYMKYDDYYRANNTHTSESYKLTLDGHSYYMKRNESIDIPGKDFLKVRMKNIATISVTYTGVTQGTAVCSPAMTLRYIRRYNVE